MKIVIKSGAERPIIRRHPWVFSGAVARVEGSPRAGDLVPLHSTKGEFLAYGLYSPDSRIRVRLLSWDESDRVDDQWWKDRLTRAVNRRLNVKPETGATAFRLVFSESDGLPGLIADWYDGYIVLQTLVPGMDRVKGYLSEIMSELTGAQGVFERSDAEARSLEGLPPNVGLLRGQMPPERIVMEEHGFRFQVDLVHGQKTGFFLDQRENRRIVGRMAEGRNVLDVFAHSFAFSIHAYGNGAARVDRIESSAEAVRIGEDNLALNEMDSRPGETVTGDAFRVLREFRDRGQKFDLIVLDPPKFAPTRAYASKAARGYKDINLLAMKLLNPEGILATFSCSQGVDADLFQKIIFGAGLDAKRDIQVMTRLGQPADHPVLLTFPESWYLKGLVCRVC